MAESGSAGASVLMVHAASLENEFVADGYSYEKYGRALWTNDFVFAGQRGPGRREPPSGRTTLPRRSRRRAAGINGKATFVSRGGTPGTTVAEHGIWAARLELRAEPRGPSAVHGQRRQRRRRDTDRRRSWRDGLGAACPGNGALPTGAALPTWYVATGLSQGPNVQAANACNGFPSGAEFLLRLHRQRDL